MKKTKTGKANLFIVSKVEKIQNYKMYKTEFHPKQLNARTTSKSFLKYAGTGSSLLNPKSNKRMVQRSAGGCFRSTQK